jgi:hypothetical protein
MFSISKRKYLHPERDRIFHSFYLWWKKQAADLYTTREQITCLIPLASDLRLRLKVTQAEKAVILDGTTTSILLHLYSK